MARKTPAEIIANKNKQGSPSSAIKEATKLASSLANLTPEQLRLYDSIIKENKKLQKQQTIALKQEKESMKRQFELEEMRQDNLEKEKDIVSSRRELSTPESVPQGVMQTLARGATDSSFKEEMSFVGQTASTILGAVAQKSQGVGMALDVLGGGMTATTAAFSILGIVVAKLIEAFTAGFSAMWDLQKVAAYQTNLTNQDLTAAHRTFQAQADAINEYYTENNPLAKFAAVMLTPGGIIGDTILGLFDANINIAKVTAIEAMEVLNKALGLFKNASILNNANMAQLLIGLDEMGYNIQGSIGQLIKTEYWRGGATTTLLKQMVNLSQQSTMSLDELVGILSETIPQQNLSAWTMIRSGMSAGTAQQVAAKYGKAKVSIAAAADTMGLSQAGVDAIFSMFSDIISSATDPTKLGDLTKKYQVGGMTGGRSIDAIYRELVAGNFVGVFQDVVKSVTSTAVSGNMLGFEYLSSQFGSSITSVLESFGPSTISTFMSQINAMYGASSTSQNEILKSIANAPLTMEDILNTLVNEVIKFSMNFSAWVEGLPGSLFGLGGGNTLPTSYVDDMGVIHTNISNGNTVPSTPTDIVSSTTEETLTPTPVLAPNVTPPDITATPTTGEYYTNNSDTVMAINSLNTMLSAKLDVIISKMNSANSGFTY